MARKATRAGSPRSRSTRRRAGRPPAHAAGARDDLVDAAARLFVEQGYARTTTAEVARAANHSEGTLFHHFRTKRALLAEVGRREGERVLEVAFRDLDVSASPPDPELLLAPLFAYARENPDAYRLFAMDGDVEDLASGFAAKRSVVTSGLAAVLSGWAARGWVRVMNPELVARILFAATDACVRRLVLEERWDEESELLREAAHATRGVLAPLADAQEERRASP